MKTSSKPKGKYLKATKTNRLLTTIVNKPQRNKKVGWFKSYLQDSSPFKIFDVILRVIIAIVTIIIAFRANELIEIQNKRIEQQTYLAESERISSLFFELTSIYNKIDQEYTLAKQNGNNQEEVQLSNQLVGRITSITQALKPYRFLNINGELCDKPISPEKGQLLTTLLKANVDIDQFHKEVNFTHTDLSSRDLKGESINIEKLMYANFNNSDLSTSEFIRVNFSNSTITNSFFNDTKFKGTILDNASISSSQFYNTEFLDATMIKTVFKDNDKFRGAKFPYSHMDTVSFINCDLSEVDFSNSTISACKFTNTILPAAENFDRSILINNDFNGAYVPDINWLQKLKTVIDTTGSRVIEENWISIDSERKILRMNEEFYQIIVNH